MGHYGHKHELKDLFLSHFKKCGVILPSCQEAGISRSTFYRWLEDDEEFAIKLTEAYQIAYKFNRLLLDSVPGHKRHTFAHMINNVSKY